MKVAHEVLVVMAILCLLGIATYITHRLGAPHDNGAEEIAEDIFKRYTGYDIDLSPSSPEPEMTYGE